MVNVADIPHFAQALVDPAGYAADHDGSPYAACDAARADFNLSGVADGADVQPFVNLLIGS